MFLCPRFTPAAALHAWQNELSYYTTEELRDYYPDLRGDVPLSIARAIERDVGHRHANAALYRAVIVRMQFHQPTRDYVARRIAAGRTKRDIIRCLKRFLAREIYQRVMTDFRARQEIIQAA